MRVLSAKLTATEIARFCYSIIQHQCILGHKYPNFLDTLRSYYYGHALDSKATFGKSKLFSGNGQLSRR
jgi:hypothetical protein